MALSYQTEYRLGNRGRICRSYTGFPAFVAIGFDLVFGLVFELVSAAIGLALRLIVLTVDLMIRLLRIHWKILVAAMTLIVYLVTLPFAMIHQAVDRIRSRAEPDTGAAGSHRGPILKPDWALSREV